EAYRLYIRGRDYWNKRLTETLPKAIEYFQQAIDLDPGYALAYVGLADCYALLSLYCALTPREAFPKARAAALKALDLDPALAEAHNSLGVIKLFYEWDWAGAESEFGRAISLNPGYPDAHQRFGLYLTATGRFEEAAAELRRALELDPLSLITNTFTGYPFYYSRRYDRAVEHFLKPLEMDPNFSMAHFRLGLAYAQQGRYEESIAELKIAERLSGDRDAIAALGHVCGVSGRTEEARATLAELGERSKKGFVSPYNMAVVHLGLGERDEALAWLERAYAERSYWLIYVHVDPLLDGLRAEARFADLARRVRPAP
ncbi:MAG: tetratricopeptide repeat protein, partial [Pyrinomonadaceae bacterium]